MGRSSASFHEAGRLYRPPRCNRWRDGALGCRRLAVRRPRVGAHQLRCAGDRGRHFAWLGTLVLHLAERRRPDRGVQPQGDAGGVRRSGLGKAGSIWRSDGEGLQFSIVFEGSSAGWEMAVYDTSAGAIGHEFFDAVSAVPDTTRATRLMSNMWFFAPEANFVTPALHVEITEPVLIGSNALVDGLAEIVLKSCNRCARFLPINVHNERQQLSFSSHCVARRPCRHSTFGRLRNAASNEVLQLEYGFRLECRFCKKFAVNAAHNPQRTASQMKEDGARRRAIEVLLTELYEGSPSLLHRKRFAGRELADSVWSRFGGRCFKCGTRLASENDMHLDHTRPLALLWPLDQTATCLCATHNSAKRARPPSEFYDANESSRLASTTGSTGGVARPIAKCRGDRASHLSSGLVLRRLPTTGRVADRARRQAPR